MLRYARCLPWLALVCIIGTAVRGEEPAPANEQQRLRILAGLTRVDQRLPKNQVRLQQFMRRAVLLYLHSLDGLACRELFSVGDEARFVGAIGNNDGSDWNLVFLEGTGNPRHEWQGAYVFPTDLPDQAFYYPPVAERNTYWHEVNHSLLDDAWIGLNPMSDYQHTLIERIGQPGTVAYATLYEFERSLRRADQAETQYLAQARLIDYDLERQLWGEAHRQFSIFVAAMANMGNLAAEDLATYRAATGVFFSTVEQVAEFYRTGGLKRQERGEVLPIRPPAWVFYADLLLMPVHIELRDANRQDLEQPGATARAPSTVKDDVFRQEIRFAVRAQGSMARRTGTQADQALGGLVSRGHLQVRLKEEEPLVSLALAQGRGNRPVAGQAGPGGASTQVFEVDFTPDDSQPLQLVFNRRKVSALAKATTYHVELNYRDGRADRVYDSASAQVVFTLSAGTQSNAALPATAPTAPAPDPPAPAPAPTKAQPGKGLGVTMSWGPLPAGMRCYPGPFAGSKPPAPLPDKGEIELFSGAVLYCYRGEPGNSRSPVIAIELFVHKPSDSSFPTLDEYKARAKAQDPHGDFQFFKHGEIIVGGRRGYESEGGGPNSNYRANHFFFLELDPDRRIFATIDCEIRPGRGRPEVFEPLNRDLDAALKTLRFGPDASGLAVQSPPAPPLPKQFKGEPIVKDELLKRPPPPPPEPPEKNSKRQNRYTDYTSPGGYTLRLPGSWSAGAKTADAQLFNASDRLYVLACPNTKLTPPADFATFRDKLAAQWRKQDPAAQVEPGTCGEFASLVVARRQDDRLVWHVYVGAGRQAVEFRVLGAPGAKVFPAELLGVFSRMKGMAP
jgi:hypothetical protein